MTVVVQCVWAYEKYLGADLYISSHGGKQPVRCYGPKEQSQQISFMAHNCIEGSHFLSSASKTILTPQNNVEYLVVTSIAMILFSYPYLFTKCT